MRSSRQHELVRPRDSCNLSEYRLRFLTKSLLTALYIFLFHVHAIGVSVLALLTRGVINDNARQSSWFVTKGILPSRERNGTGQQSAGRSWSRRWEEAQKDRSYFEQGRTQADRRGAKVALGESKKTGRQASEVSRVVRSQVRQSASFVTSPKTYGRGLLSRETASYDL